MFGAAKPATGTGIFGQTNQTANTSSGLFGAKPNTSTPNTAGGSLFGNSQPSSNSTSNFPQFGQPAQSNSSNAAPAFGLNTAPAQPSTNSGASLFGNNSTANSASTNSTNTGSSLFGNSQPTKPTGSLFGATNSTNATNQTATFGAPASSLQNANFPSQQAPVAPAPPTITPFTRPSDLPEAFQQELENTENYIRQQVQLSEDLARVIPDQETLITSIPRDVQLLRFKLTSSKETLKFDDAQLAKLKRLVDADYADAELLAEVSNMPRKYDRLMPYFRKVVDRESQIDQMALAMRDVQHAVTAEEFGKRVTYDDQGLRTLPDALKEEYLYFMSLSDRVAELHRHIEERKGDETEEAPMY